MSFVAVSEVRALVDTGLDDVNLQDVIDREEGWLAGRIGALTGERTDTYEPGLSDSPVYLPRRAESVVVSDNAVSVADFRFTASSGMVRRTTGYWSGPVTVTWTPSDYEAVQRAVIELVRDTVSETGFESESMGSYSYSRGNSAVRRLSVVRSILLRRPAYSLRLRSSLEPA